MEWHGDFGQQVVENGVSHLKNEWQHVVGNGAIKELFNIHGTENVISTLRHQTGQNVPRDDVKVHFHASRPASHDSEVQAGSARTCIAVFCRFSPPTDKSFFYAPVSTHAGTPRDRSFYAPVDQRDSKIREESTFRQVKSQQ